MQASSMGQNTTTSFVASINQRNSLRSSLQTLIKVTKRKIPQQFPIQALNRTSRSLWKAMRLTMQLLASYGKKGGQRPSCQERLMLVSDVISLLRRRQQPSLNLCESGLIFLKPEPLHWSPSKSCCLYVWQRRPWQNKEQQNYDLALRIQPVWL